MLNSPLALDQTKGCVPFSVCGSLKEILFYFLQVKHLKLRWISLFCQYHGYWRWMEKCISWSNLCGLGWDGAEVAFDEGNLLNLDKEFPGLSLPVTKRKLDFGHSVTLTRCGRGPECWDSLCLWFGCGNKSSELFPHFLKSFFVKRDQLRKWTWVRRGWMWVICL